MVCCREEVTEANCKYTCTESYPHGHKAQCPWCLKKIAAPNGIKNTRLKTLSEVVKGSRRLYKSQCPQISLKIVIVYLRIPLFYPEPKGLLHTIVAVVCVEYIEKSRSMMRGLQLFSNTDARYSWCRGFV